MVRSQQGLCSKMESLLWVTGVLYQVRRSGENVWTHESISYLIIALLKACSCVTRLLSPDIQQKRTWQFVRSCPGRISLFLALKNPLRKLTASIDIKNRHCFVRCSHRRWALFQVHMSSRKRWKPRGCHCWLSKQTGKWAHDSLAIAEDWKEAVKWGKKPFDQSKI